MPVGLKSYYAQVNDDVQGVGEMMFERVVDKSPRKIQRAGEATR